jgi:hypothetical protein
MGLDVLPTKSSDSRCERVLLTPFDSQTGLIVPFTLTSGLSSLGKSIAVLGGIAGRARALSPLQFPWLWVASSRR